MVVGVSICFAAGIVASSEGGSPPFRSVVVRSARIRSGSSLTPLRFRSGSEVRSGSAAVPQWFRASSAVAPQRFRTASEVVPHFLRTSSAAVPHYFRTTSALLPQRFRTSSALLPHNCQRNGGDPPSVILSALYAPRRIMARLVSFWLFSGCQWRALFKGTAWADCLLSPLPEGPAFSFSNCSSVTHNHTSHRRKWRWGCVLRGLRDGKTSPPHAHGTFGSRVPHTEQRRGPPPLPPPRAPVGQGPRSRRPQTGAI